MSNVIPFNFKSFDIRVIQDGDGNFWFVVKDVARILGYRDAATAVRSVPDRHKGTHSVRTLGGMQGMLAVDEPGLYRLVLRSDKAEAEPFMDWVTEEVLPSVRKTGSYQTNVNLPVPQSFADALRLAADLEEKKEKAEKERDHAVATKAEIGSRREATAMATASAASRKAKKLEEKLGVSEKWKQTKAIPWLSEIFEVTKVMYQQVGKKLTALSAEIEVEIKEIEDSKYGTVKAYHVDVINEFHERLKESPDLLAKYRITSEAA